MGVKDLRDSFNAGQSQFVCQQAMMSYTRAHDTEWQILSFHGTDSEGHPFAVNSDPIPPGDDVNAAAAATAQRLIEQRKPAP